MGMDEIFNKIEKQSEDIVVTDAVKKEGTVAHYLVVVLRDDQLERIAEKVAEKLR